MKSARTMLTWSLRGGAIYFVAVTIAHWLGVKVPGLFIYYSTPSYAYLDRGIGTLAFGWSVFLFTASRQLSIVPAALFAGAAGVLGFAAITLSPEVRSLAPPGDLAAFWLEIFMLAAFVGWVAVWWIMANRSS
jgi:hypothetical protein